MGQFVNIDYFDILLDSFNRINKNNQYETFREAQQIHTHKYE